VSCSHSQTDCFDWLPPSVGSPVSNWPLKLARALAEIKLAESDPLLESGEEEVPRQRSRGRALPAARRQCWRASVASADERALPVRICQPVGVSSLGFFVCFPLSALLFFVTCFSEIYNSAHQMQCNMQKNKLLQTFRCVCSTWWESLRFRTWYY